MLTDVKVQPTESEMVVAASGHLLEAMMLLARLPDSEEALASLTEASRYLVDRLTKLR